MTKVLVVQGVPLTVGFIDPDTGVEGDGNFLIEFTERELRITADMPDSDGRVGVIYNEKFAEAFEALRDEDNSVDDVFGDAEAVDELSRLDEAEDLQKQSEAPDGEEFDEAIADDGVGDSDDESLDKSMKEEVDKHRRRHDKKSHEPDAGDE